MVHALTEAHRVLKPNGILIDLRPAAQHRRAGLGEGEAWKLVSTMREGLADDRTADRAVRQIVRDRLFQPEAHVEFDLARVMDNLQDLRTWLDEFSTSNTNTHEWLYKKIERDLVKKSAGIKITIRGMMKLVVMRKLNKHIE